MSNTEKKIDALIEALGFDVEVAGGKAEINDEDIRNLSDVNKPLRLTRVTESTIEYKLTKREGPAMVPMAVDSDAWSCIVDYLIAHFNEIHDEKNDFATLQPALDFINRNSL